ncbi:hypothetical protein [Streptomyces sp. I8-5]|uniref:hypothetical protein n=1 Tax=Streptomyces sp. I8-5 TaxID=3104277 RepID=UPI003868631B
MQTPLTATSDPPDHLAAAAAPTAGVVALPGGILASAVADAPLEPPFGQAAALRCLDRAQRARRGSDRVHLAITTDGHQALGEVPLNRTTGSIGYIVGAAHRDSGWQCALLER